MRHCLDINSFGDLVIAGPACTLPAHLGLEQSVHQSGLSKTAVT